MHAMNTSSHSLAFDRAAGFYDETRLLPDDVARAVRTAILHAIGDPPAPRLLELGVGTGRIALPFLRAGDTYLGVDLSLPMMRRLEEKSPNAHLTNADITQLPFPNTVFDVAIAMHVFHLVGNWQRALDEARRVVVPGGYLAWSWHWRDDESLNRRLRRWLAREAEERGYSTARPGANQVDVAAEIDRRGADTTEVEVAQWQTRRTTLGYELEKLTNRVTSDTWMLPDAIFDECLAVVRERALADYGTLEYEEPIEEQFTLRVSQWPA